MLHELLDQLWAVDDAGDRMLRLLQEHAQRGVLPPKQLGADMGAYALEAEGLPLVAGPHTLAPDVRAAAGVGGQAQLGTIVVIPVSGLLVQHPSWVTYEGYGTSTEQVMRACQMAAADPQISAVVLRLNTAGGSVFGLKVLSDCLLKTRKEKPLWGHADSQALSAGYWLLAACEKAFASPLGLVGSIGCITWHTSYKEMDEKMGIKRVKIAAGKNKGDANENEDLPEEAKARIQAIVDECYEEFKAGVMKGRGVSAAKVMGGFGQGAAVGAKAAAAEGMIDDVVSFQETLMSIAKAAKTAARERGARAEDETPAPTDPAPEDPAPPSTLSLRELELQLLSKEMELGLLGRR